jgi:hypothetical protein
MDYTAEAMQKTLDIAKPDLHEIKDVHGITTTFATKPLHQVIAKAPETYEVVHVSTLAGFNDLILAKLEHEENFPTNFLIHVESETTVALKAKVTDEFGRRLTLIQAEPVPFDRFRFGQWIDQEAFVIQVASLFADGQDKQYVLGMASALTNDAANTSEDDGFTQKVNIKQGLRMKEPTTLKPRVSLAPYRTFPELDQPISEFVFRAKCDGEGRPHLMLVEADGGRWKIDAIAKLRKAMEAFGLTISIVA